MNLNNQDGNWSFHSIAVCTLHKMFDTWKLREIFLDGALMMNVMEKNFGKFKQKQKENLKQLKY